ncbi:hypothetical protein BSLG_007857 [Batrachochytrium salamandrivorans]|nr:hypothetical protein BSLG_007857 [Batrachochytrium salamandrivorans]
MSSRALRKLQKRSQAELPVTALSQDATGDIGNDSDVDSDADRRTSAPKPNMFDLLVEDSTNDLDIPVDESDNDEIVAAVKLPHNVKPRRKKKTQKQTSRAQKEAMNKAASNEEIDQVLRELHKEYGDIGLANDGIEAAKMKSLIEHHFKIDPRMLDADAELCRIFGSKVIRDEIRAKKYIKTAKKTVLATGRQSWPRYIGSNLCMEPIGSDQTVQTNLFSFSHSTTYQDSQRQFVQVVESHDPESLANLLQFHPFNVDALLQFSEICKHNNEIVTAAEFVERAIYTFERSFHPLFKILAGTCKLSYDRVENRSFFISIYRHIEHLSRKGCWRTAFEFQKLLANLEQGSDSLCSMTSLDILAIKAKEFAWYKEFWDSCELSSGLNLLPNSVYSISLIHWELEKESGESHTVSSQLLRIAISRFPATFNALAKQLSITKQPIAEHPYFSANSQFTDPLESTFEILGELYAERAASLWKLPEIQSWLESQAAKVADDARRSPLPQYIKDETAFRESSTLSNTPILRNLHRIIFLSVQVLINERSFLDIRSLIKYLPQDASSADFVMYDPFPPLTAEPSMYAEFRQSLLSSGSQDTGESYMNLITRSLTGLLAPRNRPEGANAGENANNDDGHRQDGIEELFDSERDDDDGGDEGEETNDEDAADDQHATHGFWGVRGILARLGLISTAPATEISSNNNADQHDSVEDSENSDLD